MTSATVGVGDGPSARRGAGDVAGLTILACCALWTLITATARGGRPEGVLLAVLALSAGYACGRIGGAVLPVGTCAVAALGGLGLAVTASPVASTADPARAALSGVGVSSLGHTSPVAALLVLSCGTACCGAWATGRAGLRLALRLFALGTAVAAAVLGSAAGLLGCVAVLLCSLTAARAARRGAVLVGLGLAAALLVAAVGAVAASALPSGLADALTGPLTRSPRGAVAGRPAARRA
ncbi:hypothetical protein [Streptomyces cavernicola]|uniref:hypothetical protein n=1 Tax=Streptomyces cavernicola TaxID=3043613 RepID=UPI0032B7B108